MAQMHESADAVYIDILQGHSVDEWPVQTVRWPINKLIDVVQMSALNQHSS